MKKNVYELFKKYNLPNSLTNFTTLCKFDQEKKIWQFSGYRCLKCDKRIPKEKIYIHREKC